MKVGHVIVGIGVEIAENKIVVTQKAILNKPKFLDKLQKLVEEFYSEKEIKELAK